MQTLVIEKGAAVATKRRNKAAMKSRSFSAVKLAHVCADMLWDGGETGDNIRPIWIALAETDTALRPFLANFRLGRPAEVLGSKPSYGRQKGVRFELLKSAGYVMSNQRLVQPNGTIGEVVIASLPLLLNFDPGMLEPEVVNFVVLPPLWWVAEQRAQLRADRARCAHLINHIATVAPYPAGVSFCPEELIDLAPIAAYVMGYVDRRTRRPMVPSIAFALQLYIAGLREGIFSLSATENSKRTYRWDEPGDRWLWARHRWADSFIEDDTASVGLLPGLVAGTTHNRLDRVLMTEVQRYAAVQ